MFKIGYCKSTIRKRLLPALIALLMVIFSGCQGKSEPYVRIFRLNSLKGLVATANLSYDQDISCDGLGSIRVDTEEKTTAYLFVIDSIPVDRARLKWSIMCRTEDFEGNVFLEMGIKIGREEDIETYLHYSKDSINGNTDWQKLEIKFLADGQKSLLTQLNVVIDGSGTAWLDRARFMAEPR